MIVNREKARNDIQLTLAQVSFIKKRIQLGIDG